ncbi:uncharacterized protein ACVW00_003821 [Marmoricola sp. URHA0025 HA25]
MREFYEMSDEECRASLHMVAVGRVCVTTPEGPYAVPVNFTSLGETIYFRVPPDSVLAAHADGSTVAFEVDRISPRDRTGWSVLARGPGREVRDADELTRVEAADGPEPWMWRPGRVLYAVDWVELSGRRMWDSAPAAPQS